MAYVYRRPADFMQRERTVAILTVSVLVETIVAQEFPMGYYQTTGVKELRSKVTGATISKVANDFPLILGRSGESEELKSKWS